MTRRTKGRGIMSYAANKMSGFAETQLDTARVEKVLVAKPAKQPADRTKFTQDFMRRYPKTIAYLAK